MCRPRFKACFRYEVIPSEGVLLLSEGQTLILPSTFIELAQLLDGEHTIEEIISLLQQKVPQWEVLSLLARIRDYVVDAPPPMPSEQAAFWEMLGVNPESAYQCLQSTCLTVKTFGNIDPSPFYTLLTSLGVRLSDQGEQWVVLTDDYLQEGLDAFNQKALAKNHSWMLVKPIGTEISIGSLFIPGKTGCWECLRHRLQGKRKAETYFRQRTKTTIPIATSIASLPSTQQIAFGIAATEIVKWLVLGANKLLEGNIVTVNALTLEKYSHRLIHRPQCPACGDPTLVSQKQSTSLLLQSCQKKFMSDGGHRSSLPQETLKRLEHEISPITGIISTLERTNIWEGEQPLTSSYISKGIHYDWNDNLNSLHKSLLQCAGGKGKSDVQAKVSAIGEAIEHYAGGFQGDECRIRARLNDLDRAIHPNACMLFSERQFQHRTSGTTNPSRLNWIPEPFNEDQEIEWSPVWSLTDNEPRYVPTAYCYYNFNKLRNISFTRADSNGCAAGNTLEEAILQGFMELIERDSVALWWYNRLQKPAVNLSSFDEPYFQQLLIFYQKHCRDLWVIDITSDLEIPTFAAISRRNDQAVENIILGFGTHFDPQIAILRSLTELNQSLPAVFSTKLEQSRAYRDHYSEALEWWETATIQNQPYLIPDETVSTKVKSDYPSKWSNDVYIDVMACAKLAEDNNLEMLVLDQTRPDVEFPVVKVIVPGLRHFWPRFAPGRLYDVPVQIGWLATPLAEEHLNPLSVFF